MSKIIKNTIKNELAAICLFAYLIGAGLAMLILYNDLNTLKEYLDLMEGQIGSTKISKDVLFIYILSRRISMYAVVAFLAGIIKNKYLVHIFYGIISFGLGFFFLMNIMLFGIKGVLSGLILIIPQWIIYILVCDKCIREICSSKRLKSIHFVVIMLFLLVILSLGVLLESYVTLPLTNKIIF